MVHIGSVSKPEHPPIEGDSFIRVTIYVGNECSAFGSSSCNAERISGHTHTRSSQRSETDDDRMIVIMPDPNTSILCIAKKIPMHCSNCDIKVSNYGGAHDPMSK